MRKSGSEGVANRGGSHRISLATIISTVAHMISDELMQSLKNAFASQKFRMHLQACKSRRSHRLAVQLALPLPAIG